LREVAATAPYMHDGSLATLEQAVDWELYYQGQGSGQPIGLSQTERADLLAFLRALTSQHNSPSLGAPKLIVQGEYR
jgi:cytochrome c peroxidase